MTPDPFPNEPSDASRYPPEQSPGAHRWGYDRDRRTCLDCGIVQFADLSLLMWGAGVTHPPMATEVEDVPGA